MTDMTFSLVTAGLGLLVLIGVALIGRVKTAGVGNALCALGMLLAILLTLYRDKALDDSGLFVAMAAGVALGVLFSLRVKMIRMPQAAALWSGIGGGAAAIVGLMQRMDPGGDLAYPVFSAAAAGLAIVMGMLTLAGGVAIALKPEGAIPQKPVARKGRTAWTVGLFALSIAAVALLAANPSMPLLCVPCVVFSTLLGALFANRADSADRPVIISLLNSFSGIAVGMAGIAVSNPLLAAFGGIVGSSGLVLARTVCNAMNRRLSDILLGQASKAHMRKAKSDLDAKRITPEDIQQLAGRLKKVVISTKEPTEDVTGEVDATQILQQARRVVFVPGQGMAASKAQEHVKALADTLESFGAAVKYAIHPAAGRMPGHMNVLLAEAGVPYDQLFEMDKINPELSKCDVCIVIGANDVVNPAANTAEGTPIYGMPIVNVTLAKHLILCNLDKKPGCAGVENPLYRHAPNVTLMLGDAKASLMKLLAGINA